LDKFDLKRFILCIIICEAIILLPSLLVTPNLSWYNTLVKPLLTPPGALIGIIWFSIAFLLGVGLYEFNKIYETKLLFKWSFVTQATLNVLWTVMFFGQQSLLLGFVFIVALWVAVLWTIKQFYKVNHLAAWCLAPYIVWVTIAGYFNLQLLLLN
jgi:translocator protein